MPKKTASRSKPPARPRTKALVLLVDDKRAVCDKLRTMLVQEVGDKYEVTSKKTVTTALRFIQNNLKKKIPVEIPIVAVDMDLAGGNADPALDLIRKTRGLLPSSRILAYTFRDPGTFLQRAIDAKADRFIKVEHLEAVVTQLFLEKELHELRTTNPLVEVAIQHAHIGLSVLDTDMNILWANDLTKQKTGIGRIAVGKCWECYHKFYSRKAACANCTAKDALDKAYKELVAHGAGSRIPESSDLLVTGKPMLLPLTDGVRPVRVRAAPLLSWDRKKVLAVVEASEFIDQKEWEDASAADQRFRQVLEAARSMTFLEDGSPDCPNIAVYYQPKQGRDYYLFDAAIKKGSTLPVAPVLRQNSLPEGGWAGPAWAPKALDDLHRGNLYEHLYLGKRIQHPEINLLIDILREKRCPKPLQLFTADLAPYWDYLEVNFSKALEAREERWAVHGQSQIQEFLKRASNPSERAHPATCAVECIRKAFSGDRHDATTLFSVHIRSWDQNRNALALTHDGFGIYQQTQPLERALEYEEQTKNSAYAASHRQPVWAEHVDLDNLRLSVGHVPTEEEEVHLKQITGYCTIPLFAASRLLGTLSVQFCDDSALSPARRGFLTALASALSSSWGWAERECWTHRWIDYLGKLDDIMLAPSQPGSLPVPDEAFYQPITRMSFELTSAACALFYQRDPSSGIMRLVAHAMPPPLGDRLHFPATVPDTLGVLGVASRSQRAQHVQDYNEQAWKPVREGFIAALPSQADRNTVAWVRSEIAVPIVVAGVTVGVLAVVSPIPGWLPSEDFETMSQIADKVSKSLVARRAGHDLTVKDRTIESLATITDRMGGLDDLPALQRLFLLGITSGHCLGFSRAILLELSSDRQFLTPRLAVGSISHADTLARWREANIAFDEQIRVCLDGPTPVRNEGLMRTIESVTLELDDEPAISRAITMRTPILRTSQDLHPINDPAFRKCITAGIESNVEYILCPLAAAEEVWGLVWADRAFQPEPSIDKASLRLLGLLCAESAWIICSNVQRQKRDRLMTEAERNLDIAKGVSYSLRTRASALEAQLDLLKGDIGDEHQAAINKMERAVSFFKRAGTLAAKHVHLGEVNGRTQPAQPVDMRPVIEETALQFADRHIEVNLGGPPLVAAIPRQQLEDLLLELFLNAHDFTDSATGRIVVSRRAAAGRVVVEIADNGPGVPPEQHPRLFQMFMPFPATRMGMGLAYARALARANGGDITETGTYGQGACFRIELPEASDKIYV